MSNRMDKKLKERWIKALRSGKYKQGGGNLRVINKKTNEAKYCCLGVLVDIADEFDLEPYEFRGGDSYNDINEVYAHNGDESLPDYHWLKSIGLDNNIANRLASMNDGSHPYVRKHSFKQIACYIDRMVKTK